MRSQSIIAPFPLAFLVNRLCLQFFLSLAPVSVLVPLHGEPIIPEINEASFIDTVWAGHPVEFDFEVWSDTFFVAYFDAERRLTVASRPLSGTEWTLAHPAGREVPNRDHRSNTLGWDSHNGLELARDSEGFLHLAGNMHVDPLIYYKSSEPEDVRTLQPLDRMTGERETRCTYPLFFTDQGGTLYFRYRDGQSGEGADLYNRYDLSSQTWIRLLDRPLHDGQGKRNAHASTPHLGPDGYFHLIWMWRETYDARSNHRLSYARSKDLLSWESATGKPMALPFTIDSGGVIDPSGPASGLMNGNPKLGFDSSNRLLVTYHRYDEEGNSQLYIARFEDGAWKFRPMTSWDFRWDFGGAGTFSGEVYVSPPQLSEKGTIEVRYWSRRLGHGRLLLSEGSLDVLEDKVPFPRSLPSSLLDSQRGEEYKVHTLEKMVNGVRYVLRWETLRANRDRPREEIPDPSDLQLFRLSQREPSISSD